jgi:hypothetical protein
MRAKVTRKSGCDPTSWTSVVAQPASDGLLPFGRGCERQFELELPEQLIGAGLSGELGGDSAPSSDAVADGGGRGERVVELSHLVVAAHGRDLAEVDDELAECSPNGLLAPAAAVCALGDGGPVAGGFDGRSPGEAVVNGRHARQTAVGGRTVVLDGRRGSSQALGDLGDCVDEILVAVALLDRVGPVAAAQGLVAVGDVLAEDLGDLRDCEREAGRGLGGLSPRR